MEPLDLAWVIEYGAEGANLDNPQTAANAIAIAARRAKIKDWKRRYENVASLITQSVDDGTVQTLSVHGKDPKLIWDALSSNFNTVTPAQQSLAMQDFQAFRVTEDETYLEMKQRFNELMRKVGEKGGVVSAAYQLQTLLGSLPANFDILRESFFA